MTCNKTCFPSCDNICHSAGKSFMTGIIWCRSGFELGCKLASSVDICIFLAVYSAVSISPWEYRSLNFLNSVLKLYFFLLYSLNPSSEATYASIISNQSSGILMFKIKSSTCFSKRSAGRTGFGWSARRFGACSSDWAIRLNWVRCNLDSLSFSRPCKLAQR